MCFLYRAFLQAFRRRPGSEGYETDRLKSGFVLSVVIPLTLHSRGIDSGSLDTAAVTRLSRILARENRNLRDTGSPFRPEIGPDGDVLLTPCVP